MMIALETINFDTNKETKYIKNKIRNPPPPVLYGMNVGIGISGRPFPMHLVGFEI